MCCLAMGVLTAAQQWTGLQQLQLDILGRLNSYTEEYCASTILGGVQSLQQLRRLVLQAPALGSCCAGHIQQLKQLTCLHLTATQQPEKSAADLAGLGCLTNLVELRLSWALAPHLPAGPEGPYCLPSSLVRLHVCSLGHSSPAPMACWVAHLPGCPQLQHLRLSYGPQQHTSAHPTAVLRLLAQHTPRLCSLIMARGAECIHFSRDVAGLPATSPLVPAHWQPDASLAALAGLQRLSGDDLLHIRDQAHWQHLAQATALSSLDGVWVSCVPEMEAGSTLRLLELDGCRVELGGYDVGRLLLACPALQSATISVTGVAAPAAAGARLLSHPTLGEFQLRGCNQWGQPAEAAAHWAALAPVLSGVSDVDVVHWPLGSTRAALVMPDLSPCTALTNLAFAPMALQHSRQFPLEQENILLMLAPLVQLQHLEITSAPRVNARIALALQSMLPQLQCLMLGECGHLVPPGPAASSTDSEGDLFGDWDSDEEEGYEREWPAQQQVLQLLRDDLEVRVCGYAE
jgi:hypothetical protein